MKEIIRHLEVFVTNRFLFWGVVLANLVGIGIGLDYYWTQLSVSPIYQWIFIADCPLYAILFVVAFFMCRYRKLPALLGFVVTVGLIKYAIWTISVIGLYSQELLFADFSYNSLLIFLHLGMILEAVVLLNYLPKKSTWIRALDWTVAWFLVNDVFDYGFGTHPFLPGDQWVTLLLYESMLATFVLIFGGFWLLYRES